GPRLRGSRRRHGHVRDVASAGQVTVVVAVPYTRWMKRLLLLGSALVLVLTACGGSHKSATATHSSLSVLPVSLSVPQVAAQRRREARRKAERLLRRVVLPSGAIRVRHIPARSRDLLGRSGLGASLLTKFA